MGKRFLLRYIQVVYVLMFLIGSMKLLVFLMNHDLNPINHESPLSFVLFFIKEIFTILGLMTFLLTYISMRSFDIWVEPSRSSYPLIMHFEDLKRGLVLSSKIIFVSWHIRIFIIFFIIPDINELAVSEAINDRFVHFSVVILLIYLFNLKDKNIILSDIDEIPETELKFADKTLKADKEVVMAVVKQNGMALQYADETLKADKEVVLAAVKKTGYALQYADETLKADKEVVLAAVNENGSALEYADEWLKEDGEVVLAAVKHDFWALDYADEWWKKDKEFMVAAVKQNGYVLEYADETLKADKEVVLAAVKKTGYALQYADETLKADKEVVLAAVKRDGMALEFVDETLKADKKIVLAAVKEDGSARQYADETLKADKEIVLAVLLNTKTWKFLILWIPIFFIIFLIWKWLKNLF